MAYSHDDRDPWHSVAERIVAINARVGSAVRWFDTDRCRIGIEHGHNTHWTAVFGASAAAQRIQHGSARCTGWHDLGIGVDNERQALVVLDGIEQRIANGEAAPLGDHDIDTLPCTAIGPWHRTKRLALQAIPHGADLAGNAVIPAVRGHGYGVGAPTRAGTPLPAVLFAVDAGHNREIKEAL